jgi:ABC-type sulfate/molybdate transport systems ATPase subunit
MPLITSLADRIVALESGRVITVGPPKEVLAHPQVVASYLGTTDTDLTHLTATRANKNGNGTKGGNGKKPLSRTRPLVAPSRQKSNG